MTDSKLTAISILALASLTVALLAPAAQADGPNRTALMVVHGDGRMSARCIAFDEAEISSFEALQRSGLSVRFSGYGSLGAAVCAIEGEGCPREDQQCFCQCLGTPCLFWSFWLWRDGQWALSQRGASNVPVHDGELHAWFWSDAQTPPPAASFEQICPPPPTETPLPTDTPGPTDTPVPTATPVPTQAPVDTPVPTNVPTDTAVPTEPATHTPTLAPEPTPTVARTRTATIVMLPASAPVVTSTVVVQQPVTPDVPTPSTAIPQVATVTSTASPSPQPTLTAVPLPLPTATPEPPPAGGLAPLAQYGVFALLAALLLGGFWLVQRRRGGR